MSPRLPKVIYQIFNLQLLRRYAPRNDGPKNRTVQRALFLTISYFNTEHIRDLYI
ncbi:hypothetical protein SC943_15025 [Legionella pneumophila serogroup 1]